MKVPHFQRLVIMAALYLFFSVASFAQNGSHPLASSIKIENNLTHHKKSGLKHVKTQPLPLPSKFYSSPCDNDQTPPVIHCPAGNCQPNARAAYLISYNWGEPWGFYDNINAMNNVFGGDWDAQYFETSDAATLLSPAYKVIFLEGSYYSGYALNDFVTTNSVALENWVAAGGALFINCATVNAPSVINLGFDGVTFQGFISGFQATMNDPSHPIFNGPFVPANGDFYGSEFHYGNFSGNIGLPLLTGVGVCLSEKVWGAGKVIFGSIIPPSFDGPQPNIQNMWQNILSDLNAVCSAGLTVPADAGQCFATVTDQSIDATATDDCAVVSLTHDFVGAPSNNTLNGAVLPAGPMIVRWTATDAAGNTGTCETLLFVRESEAPTITCQGDVSVSPDPGACSAVVDYNITASDNCTTAPTIISTPASGAAFPIGNTTVYARATDVSGNLSTCSFVVTVTPNAEVCNGLDDDCNGYVDDGAPGDNLFYADYDGDGYGDPNNSTTSCLAPSGYVNNALDCDDTNYYIQPGMYEYCDGVDNNCDGNIDEGVAPTWYFDADGDGYGDPNIAQNACNQPEGFVYYGGDCDDTNAYIHPGALEDCTNDTDENCDGILGDNNFTIDEVHTDVYCGSNPDGAITLTVTPAQNYPVYLWSNGFSGVTTVTNLQFGTYKVTVSNECGTTKTKTIVIQPSPTPTLQVNLTGTDQICGGAGNGSITAEAQDGCGAYTYLWNTGATDPSISGLSGGYYSVVVTDACGCTQSASFTINEPYPLSIYVNLAIPLLDGTYFIQVLPYGGTSTYQFRRSTPPAGFTDWSASNGFVNVSAGDYVFEVLDQNGCTAQVPVSLSPFSPRPVAPTTPDPAPEEIVSRTNNDQPAIEPLALKGLDWAISLFPNPTSGTFTAALSRPATPGMSIGITDVNGRLLLDLQTETGSDRQTINADVLPAGLYFLQVISAGKVVSVERFVKQ